MVGDKSLHSQVLEARQVCLQLDGAGRSLARPGCVFT
jgi:hypothetical protein